MEKTVQIVTIPLDKQGFATGDICKCIKPLLYGDSIGETTIATHTAEDEHNPYWQAQQLLVLSDDKIEMNDMYYASGSRTLEYSVFKADTERLVKIGNELGVKKIIASYPQIKGTLPISKETIQAWIDAGTPEEGVADSFTCSKIPFITSKRYPEAEFRKYITDTGSNLLLTFSTAVTNEDISNAVKKLGQTVEDIRSGKLVIEPAGQKEEDIYDAVADYREKHPEKPTVLTDEEIEKKAEGFSRRSDKRVSFNVLLAGKIGYKYGYKQALKDLGYE